MAEEAPKGYLDALLLAVVARRPAHGYAIINDLRLLSDGAFDLAEGAVYPALHRLEAERLVVSEWESEGGRRRRVYHVSRSGRKYLRTRAEEWKRVSRGVSSVLENT